MINSVHKAATLLKILSGYYPKTVSLEELSSKTGIGKSTCVHILNTLINETLVEKVKYAHYCLGAGCFYLTRSGKFDQKRLDICRPVLRWLRDKTGETALIAEIHNSEKYTVDYAIGNYELKNSGDNILLDKIYRTATGRLLTAHLSDNQLCDLIQHQGMPKADEWRDFTDIADLQKTLKELRTAPWISVENDDMLGFAAPLYDGNTVFASLGLAVVKKKGSATISEKEPNITNLLLRTAKEINRRLRF